MPRRGAGFTLLELLLALAIAGLATAVLIPSLRHSSGVDLRAAARDLATGLRYARNRALAGGTSVTLRLDLDTGRFEVPDSGMHGRIPDSIRLSLYTAQSELVDAHSGAIRFFPDGSSTGGEVKCTGANGSTARVQVDWLTGHVRIFARTGPDGTGT